MNHHDGANWMLSETPIYARLVEELGDVPTEVNRVSVQIHREADRAVDFSALRGWAA
ncbi:hypothetical protein [Streptomyces sp. NPDC004232]|uniref:hypothetical protein n=1 Tax=unclassified Streptomyces TaxID=2593676 RepID=UPI001DA52E35|nr:hypothetical protein [Streptomyces sp. tea 10]